MRTEKQRAWTDGGGRVETRLSGGHEGENSVLGEQ